MHSVQQDLLALGDTVDVGQENTKPAREVAWSLVDGSEGRVYAIPHTNLPTFQERFAKLVKRATRIGVIPPSYTELRQEPKVFKETTDEEDERGRSIVVERVVMIHHLAIFHPSVVVSGWEFMAKLEHTEEGNILHTLPGKTVPHQYRDCGAWCDHCQTRRRRNDTFVLHHTVDDKWQQVGRNCLADFLGRDAEKYADAAEMYYTLDKLASASEGGDGEGWGGRVADYAMLPTYLGFVAEVISHVGWKSRSNAHTYGGAATADIAITHMWRPRGMKDEDFLFREPTPKSFQTALDAIAWAEELSDEDVQESDYLHNIRIIAKRGVVGGKQFGYAASMVSSYLKHVGELQIKARRQTTPSTWVGEVGERRVFHLLVEKVITIEGLYGVSLLHLMSDDDGNKVIWFGHGSSLDAGKKAWLKGTIKAHTEREGIKQTQLSRCEQVEMKSYLVVYQEQEYQFEALDLKDAKKKLPNVLDIAKAPRGLSIVEVVIKPPTQSETLVEHAEPE